MLGNTGTVFRRELRSYFATPLGYVFLVIFAAASAVFTFYLGGFYERGQADLAPFFNFHPWLYLFLVPAIAMRLWAEERKSGSIELLLTLPISLRDAILGKYFAAWVFCGIALGMTVPIWITVSVLGDPDHGVIVTGYLGSWLMAGGFLAIGSCMSALTKNQVVAFIVGLVVCFAFMVSGFPLVLDAFRGWAPNVVVEAIGSLSLLSHFASMSKGVIDLRDILYFITLIAAWLTANAIIIDLKKAD